MHYNVHIYILTYSALLNDVADLHSWEASSILVQISAHGLSRDSQAYSIYDNRKYISL